MESKEDRQVKGALARFRLALSRTPPHRPEDKVWSTEIRARQRLEAAIRGAPDDVYVAGSIERLKGSQLTPQEAAQKFQAIIDAYSKHYKEEQKLKEERRKEAQKSLEFQKQPFYRICLGATFGVFGSYYGSSGQSRDGLKFGEEIKSYPTSVLREAINRLRNRDLRGYPLQGYNSEYIEEVINYLTSLVIARGEPEQAPNNEEKESLSVLKRTLNLFRGH